MPININTQTYANITLIVKEAPGTVFEQFMMTIERDFITSIVSFSGVELRKRFNFLFSAKLPRLKELSIRCTMHQRTSLGSTVYIRLIFLVFSVCKESYIICLILLCMSREVIFITNVICWRRRSFQSTTRNSNAPSLSSTTCSRLATARIIIVTSASTSRASWSHTSANSNGFFSNSIAHYSLDLI